MEAVITASIHRFNLLAAMGSLETRIKIAVFIVAILITAGLVFLATGGMNWVFHFIGELTSGAPNPRLRIIAAVIAGLILALRLYARYRDKMARKKK